MTETPVLVGICELEQRIDDPLSGREPIELMIDAVQQAAADARCPKLLDSAGSIRVIRGRWPYKNPALAVGEAIGAPSAESCLAPYGGNVVQSTVNQSALDIQAGRHDVIVITGAECGNTQAKARRAGLDLRRDLNWQQLAGTPDRLLFEDQEMSHPLELAVGIARALQVDPMFENA